MQVTSTNSNKKGMTMMEVGKLISILKSYNKDARVLIPGYEGGWDDIGEVVIDNVMLDANKEWYYGPHRSVEENGTNVVTISSSSRISPVI